MRKLIYILIFILVSPLLFSQISSGSGAFVDYRPLPNNDTLKITRWGGDWWFGPSFSGSGQQYLGSFYMPRFTSGAPDPQFNPEFEIPGSLNFGTELGLIAEWNPDQQKHVGFIRLSYLSRNYESVSESFIDDQTSKVLRPMVNLNYLDISLNYKYKLGFWGSFVYCGPNFEILLSQDSRYREEFENTGDITEWKKFQLDNPNTRIGMNVGFGFDIFMLALDNARLRFNPFVEADFGTGVFEQQNSGINDANVNVAQLKFGVALKWGADEMNIDTLKFDPTYKGPVLASANINFDVDIDKYLTQETLKSVDIAYIPLPEKVEKVREEPEIKRPENLTQKPEEKRPSVNIQPNRMQTYTYETSAGTGFSETLENYLSSVAQFMKNNPYSEVRVIGHSDNLGTPEQNQRRSERRADRVVQYLLSKGIDRYRILARGEGDRRPIADTKTAEGRAKNRRVEITVVQ